MHSAFRDSQSSSLSAHRVTAARAEARIYKRHAKKSRMSRTGALQLQFWLRQTAALSKMLGEMLHFFTGDAFSRSLLWQLDAAQGRDRGGDV